MFGAAASFGRKGVVRIVNMRITAKNVLFLA